MNKDAFSRSVPLPLFDSRLHAGDHRLQQKSWRISRYSRAWNFPGLMFACGLGMPARQTQKPGACARLAVLIAVPGRGTRVALI
jgi:hypothetical protein